MQDSLAYQMTPHHMVSLFSLLSFDEHSKSINLDLSGSEL